MVHRGTRSKAAQARRADRGILHCKEESYQVSSVKLLERSEINALSMHTQEQIAESMNAMQRQIAELASQWRGTPPWRKLRRSGTGVGQVDDAASTTASRKVGGHKGKRPPVKLRQRRGKELGEELPSVAEEDAELHHQCIPRSSGTARVGSNDSSAHHSSTRRTTIPLRSRSTDQVTDLEDKMHQVFAVFVQVT